MNRQLNYRLVSKALFLSGALLLTAASLYLNLLKGQQQLLLLT